MLFVEKLPDDHSRYQCFFKEMHCKVGFAIITLLNMFTFTMLLVQTVLSGEGTKYDYFAVFLQGIVLVTAALALAKDWPCFILPTILFWLTMAGAIAFLIALAILFAMFPTNFNEKMSWISGTMNLMMSRSEPEEEKITMVRGVALTGSFMLTILFFVNIWFLDISSKCYKYMRAVRKHRRRAVAGGRREHEEEKRERSWLSAPSTQRESSFLMLFFNSYF